MFDLLDHKVMAASSKFPPRDYQESCFDEAITLVGRGVRRQLYVLATGLGKTVIFSQLPAHFPEHYKHGVLVLVHRDELAFQAAEKIQQSNPFAKVGVEKAKYRAEHDCDFVVASVQTIGRRNSTRLRKFLERFAILITDECHHVKKGGQYARVLNAFGLGDRGDKVQATELPVDRLSFGFTATPNRNDGAGLAPFYDVIAKNLDISFGIENSWLVPIMSFSERTDISLDSVTVRAGDFAEGDLEKVVNISPRNAKIVSTYLKMLRGELEGQTHIPNGQALVFTSGVQHAHDLAAAFVVAGVAAVAIDGDTDKDLRKSLVAEFKAGRIKVICNCGVFTEGFDAVACDVVFMARPTQSESLYLQMMGRGLRPICNVNFPTVERRARAIANSVKKCLFLVDFVDNISNNKKALFTAPRLVGLNTNFNAKGRSLFGEVKKKVEDKIKEKPNRPVREAASFEEIDVIAEKIDIWDLPDHDAPIREMSPFKWLEVEEGVYHLNIPIKPREYYIRLEGDQLDNWRSTKVYPATMQVNKEGKREWHPEHVVEGEKAIKGLDNAVRAVDTWVRKKAPTCLNLMYHSPKWGKKPASSKQISKLKNQFGISIPDGMKISMADASQLIDAAIQQKRNARFIERRTTDGNISGKGTEGTP